MKRFLSVLMIMCVLFSLGGCQLMESESVKLRDLEFTILSEDVLPDELKTMIDERKAAAFKMTYADTEALYICIGYGEQATGGYSITLEELYLAEDAIYVETTLLGPDAEAQASKTPSYPYIVIKTEKLDRTVICE